MAQPMESNAEPGLRGEPDHEIVIVGSGFSGIGAAIELQRKGIHDYIILEKSDDLGGTWRDANYPGLTVDMPSFIYSYPFEMSPEWDRVYPTGPEIKAYTDDELWRKLSQNGLRNVEEHFSFAAARKALAALLG